MNKDLFKSNAAVSVKATDTVNQAGGKAYKLSDKASLAQLVVSGCFNGTYYSSAEDQLKKVLELAQKVDVEFLAKLAVYARQNALMKDSPAVLAALVGAQNTILLSKIFTRVVNDPKMFRNFIKAVRSGVGGKKSFGTRTKKLLQKWLENLTDEQLFKASLGNDPKLEDCLKMLHPKPKDQNRSALYGYLLGKEHNPSHLCNLVQDFERFKKNLGKDIPNVPFQFLTALPLKDPHWKQIAEDATWNQLRMNLNTFARHNVFTDKKLVKELAKKLSNPELVHKSKTFPYQLFTAYLNVESSTPVELTNALQDAMEHSLNNIPVFDSVAVLIDVSGSMSSPATGNRGTATSKMTCVDVASLFASSIMRVNPNAEVVPFDTRVHQHCLNPRDSVMTNAKTLAKFGGGGTDCGSALRHLNDKQAKHQLVVMISDNQSWMSNSTYSYGNSTGMASEWAKYLKRNPNAKLVCWDIQPYANTQVNDQKSVLNLGGFNGDAVFEVTEQFAKFGNDAGLWLKDIESVEL